MSPTWWEHQGESWTSARRVREEEEEEEEVIERGREEAKGERVKGIARGVEGSKMGTEEGRGRRGQGEDED
eukprot:188746-Hanusia_phi.AAC.1